MNIFNYSYLLVNFSQCFKNSGLEANYIIFIKNYSDYNSVYTYFKDISSSTAIITNINVIVEAVAMGTVIIRIIINEILAIMNEIITAFNDIIIISFNFNFRD